MKKLLGITVLTAVLLFTAVAGYRRDIDRNSKDEPVSVNREIKSEKEEGPGESAAEQAGPEETGTETGQKVQQTAKPEESSFLLRIDTLYTRTNKDYFSDSEDVAGGHIQSGKIKTGDRAVLVKGDGTCYETTVEGITREGETEYHIEEAGGRSLLYIRLEGIEPDKLEYGDLLLGTAERERGIPVDFPFEKSEEYSLTLALAESGDKQGELRLHDKTGKVLQRIPYGTFTEQVYYVVNRNDRRNLVFFSDEDSDAGRFLEWRDGQFLELEMEIERGLLKYDDLLLTQESEKSLVMEIYRPHPNGRLSEEIRRFTLQKDTGELVIWDCLDRKNVFQGTVLMEKDGTPVNETYYQVKFTEGLYAWLQGGEDDTVPVDLFNLSSADEHFAEYESREEFLSDYGFADGKPMYEFYDRMDNLRLELYGNESEELFCGILYRYFYDSKKEKCFRMTGFVTDDIRRAEWVDDTYSVLSSFDNYEKTIEYTADKKPAYFLVKGDDGTREKEEENVTLMAVNYIYRDDGTLYDRHYWHNSYWAGSTRSSEDSLYDEKERLVYKQAYITHGTLEDYYIYLDDGDKPAYHLWFDYYGGGAVPETFMDRYQ